MVSRKRHFYASPVFVHRQNTSHFLISYILLRLLHIRILTGYLRNVYDHVFVYKENKKGENSSN